MRFRLLAHLAGIAAVAASLASCDVHSTSGSAGCFLGPCTVSYPIPDYEYDLVGTPNVATDPSSSSRGTMRVGDTIAVYFVRRAYAAPCTAPADTIRSGTWSITGPWGQFGDFSAIATITPMSDGRAIVRATASGHFGVRYVPAANNQIPNGYVWQNVRFCPSSATSPEAAVYDFGVSP